jgi:uncharacterized protein (DUF2225 family)
MTYVVVHCPECGVAIAFKPEIEQVKNFRGQIRRELVVSLKEMHLEHNCEEGS